MVNEPNVNSTHRECNRIPSSQAGNAETIDSDELGGAPVEAAILENEIMQHAFEIQDDLELFENTGDYVKFKELIDFEAVGCSDHAD